MFKVCEKENFEFYYEWYIVMFCDMNGFLKDSIELRMVGVECIVLEFFGEGLVERF